MSSYRNRKVFFSALLLSIVSLFQIQSMAATGNPLLLLDYEEIDDQHFAVNTYLCDIESLSVVSFPLAYNPESVQVCGYDSETGAFVEITDGVVPAAQAFNSKCGLEYGDGLFASDKWSANLICNGAYPYISNEEGLIKLSMYTLNDEYRFDGQNEFIKIYFKRISDKPAEIRIATKFNAEHYDKTSSRGALFLNLSDVLEVECNYNGDVFSKDIESTPVMTQAPDTETPEEPDKDEPEKPQSSGTTSGTTGGTSTGGKDDTSDKTEDKVTDDKSESSQTGSAVEVTKVVFSDVKKDFWAYEPISELAQKKIINGYEDGTFKPNGSITRAELATIVTIAKQCKLIDNKKVFQDSEIEAWYNKYLVTAYESGFISGYPEGTFKPDNLISRQDLCVVLAKAFLKDTSLEDDVLSFADSDEIDAYALDSVKKIAAAGIVKGRDGNIFAPKANATRAEVARMIYLCLELAK